MQYQSDWTIAVLEDLAQFFEANELVSSSESIKRAICDVRGELAVQTQGEPSFDVASSVRH